MSCFECGEATLLHKHHVVPLSLGGTQVVELCEGCHGKVHGIDFTKHSELTKIGLQAARDRGVVLGNPKLSEVRFSDTTQARAKHIETSKARNNDMRGVLEGLKVRYPDSSLRQLASLLNGAGYLTARGREFTATQVSRILGGTLR